MTIKGSKRAKTMRSGNAEDGCGAIRCAMDDAEEGRTIRC